MSREAFKEINFRAESVAMIALCDRVIAQYQAQGFRLTLRQLYYQLVTRNVIKNTEREYKRIGALLSDARLAGLIDWDAIEDRVRIPRVPTEFENLRDLVEAAVRSYRLPRWRDQEHYVELWVEKDALAGVLQPLAREFHVTLMVNRGYSSQSAMYESGKRFQDAAEQGKECTLFYLGDHDPSGEDMVRDVRDRLELFGVDLTVEKIALTMNQVRQYNPPPNPAKMSDSRASGYVALHGNESWEVDAIPPNVLQTLIRTAIDRLVDGTKLDVILDREQQDKQKLKAAVDRLMNGTEADPEDQGGDYEGSDDEGG